jgi:hypothetical protein
MIIESKYYARLSSGQLEKYKSFIEKYYKGKSKYDIKYIFLQIEGWYISENDLSDCDDNEFLPIGIDSLQEIINNQGKTDNILFDEFWFRWWNKDEYEKTSASRINDIFGL